MARTDGNHDVSGTNFGISILLKLIRAVLGPPLASLSNLSLRDVFSLSSIRSRMRHPSVPLLPAANVIAKAKSVGLESESARS